MSRFRKDIFTRCTWSRCRSSVDRRESVGLDEKEKEKGTKGNVGDETFLCMYSHDSPMHTARHEYVHAPSSVSSCKWIQAYALALVLVEGDANGASRLYTYRT